jgi:AraC-like DNA-binding protein
MAKLQTPRRGSGEPLERFNVLRTRDPEELRARLASLYAISKLEFTRGKARFNAVLNHYQLKSVALSYARYGASVRITMSNADFYTQGFGIRGHGEAVTNDRFFVVAKGRGGAAGPGANALLKYQAGFEHVFLKISPEAVDRKLAALLGNPLSRRPLTLRGKYDQAALGTQYRLVRFLISELDRSKDAVPSLLLAELEQALIVAYLCANLSNYSDQLSRKAPPVASWQVQRATDYIEMYWDRPITIEALASATGTSARSLFASFKKDRGCSPMAFVKYVRLQRAREILSLGAPETSVKSVALKCGFRNTGHFAKSYFVRFGELPLETLKRAKRR